MPHRLEEETYRQLRTCLARGCYRLGTKLTLLQVSADFGVSSTVTGPVVRQLVKEGLLERRTKSAIVPPPATAAEPVIGPCPHTPPETTAIAERRLRQRLASRVYRPDDIVDPRGLADEFSVPVSCVTEAVARLLRDGELEHGPQQGTVRVPRPPAPLLAGWAR
ncbi:GntR family transcriptional regulator [Streptomyces albus]|uniref:GntR family transcriptional regulator n=1 Tax=Streptomyces albus TaxID=1888 RepID=UPI0013B48CED|nr:GntR family transcriptional regulator [Streptomyces albus]QID34345.1 GntR family transcriptional regulator [Streptomyces albus]